MVNRSGDPLWTVTMQTCSPTKTAMALMRMEVKAAAARMMVPIMSSDDLLCAVSTPVVFL